MQIGMGRPETDFMKTGRKLDRKRWITRLIAVMISAVVLLTGCGGDAQVEELFMSSGPLHTESESEGAYAYEQLNDKEKLVYDQIVYGIEKRRRDVRLATTSIDTMEKAYQAVRYDHCNYFWLKKFSYVTYKSGSKINAIDFRPVFSMNRSRQEEIQKKIDKEVRRLLRHAPKKGSDYDKVLYVYRTIIQEADYDAKAKNSQNIISVFLNHRTVCQGYAYATQYLLEKLGVPCTTVEGTTEGVSHAWNLVIMDGKYYYVDTTWGNSQYVYYLNGRKKTSGRKYIDYDFMGASTQTITMTHTASDVIPLPQCTAQKDNYYIHEGLYFSQWNPSAIGQAIAKAYRRGDKQVQLKFKSTDLYEMALQYFIEDYKIRNYCPGLKSVKYIENTDNNILFLIL